MTSESSLSHFRRLLLPLFLLLCFGGIFYTYYKLDRSWICTNVPFFVHKVCTPECLSTLMENFTQKINNSSILNNDLVTQPPLITKQAVQEEEKENPDNDIILLLWYRLYGFRSDVKVCSSKYGIKGCRITDDRSQYEKAHIVMVHHSNIRGDLKTLLNVPRPTFQKWVWMNMESPTFTGVHDWLNDAFNVTSSYRGNSDIFVPYGRLIERSDNSKTFKMPPKDKMVCWIVSHWNPNFRRVKYFNELSQHIKIEAYGQHFKRFVSSRNYIKTVKSCKFYLSFENSIHQDYITEKVFNPMNLCTVPVVIGPPRENYEEFVPSHSFIHVDDFKSPQELAEHLLLLDKNQTLYEQYFTWRQHFTAEDTHFGLEHACRSCEYIRNYKGYRVFKNLNKWFWG